MALSREQVIKQQAKGESLERADLRDLILDHLSLDGANLSRADLEGVSLEGSVLRKANLLSVNLRQACLKGADLEGANLFKADLEDANLEEANLQFTNLGHANLLGAKLEGANLRGACLSYAQLRFANLGRVCLEEAQLDNADLSEAYLGGARLIKANLRHANGWQASFEEVDLTEADLRDCHFPEADLTRAIFTASKLFGIEAVPEQLIDVVADWVDFSAEANGLMKVRGFELVDYFRSLKEGFLGILPSNPDQARRYYGPGDVMRNATLAFVEDSQIEIESYLENCTITLGRGTRLAIGPEGVLSGCQVIGEGEIVIHGKFYENGTSPGIVGPSGLFVGKTGTIMGMVQQSSALTHFAFEPGCALSLKIRQSS